MADRRARKLIVSLMPDGLQNLLMLLYLNGADEPHLSLLAQYRIRTEEAHSLVFAVFFVSSHTKKGWLQ